MSKSFAVRYGLIALSLSVLFLALYVTLETAPMLPGSEVGFEHGGEDWLVLIIPLTVVALAVLAGRQRDLLVAQTRQRDVMNAILQTLNGTLDGDPERALQAALDHLAGWPGAQAAAILLREQARWTTIAAQWPEAWHAIVVAQTWPPSRHTVVTIALEPAAQSEARWLCLMPIDLDEGSVGWLAVALRQKQPLAAGDAEWLLTLADQIGAALTRDRQEVRLRRRARDWEAITQINHALLAGMDLDEVLDTIVQSAQVRFGLSYVTVLWIDEAAGEFYIRARAGELQTAIIPNFRQPVTAGLAGRVRSSGQPYLAADLRQEPAYIPDINAPILSLFVAPLKVADQIVGVISFASLNVDAFGPEDVTALTMLADQAALAAENARLLTAARYEQQRLMAILRSTSDALILIDTGNRIQLLNPAAERWLKRPLSEVLGRVLDDFLDAWPLLNALKADQAIDQPFEVPGSDRAVYLATLTVAQDEQGAALGRVLVMHDITYLKQLDQLKSQMVQMLSHDIRAPLGVASGYLDLLKENLHPFTSVQAQLIQGMEIALSRMEHLAAELLDLERIEAGIDRTWAPLHIGLLAQEAVDELREEARAKQQQVELSIAESLPALSGDSLRLKQALANLISNAIKYTPRGGQVWVRLHCEDQMVVVEVQDTGYGIPASAQPRLFQRFFRAKAPGTEDIAGTGLGLSLVKAIVEQHGGEISFASEPGQGSTFTVRLPATLQQLLQSLHHHG